MPRSQFPDGDWSGEVSGLQRYGFDEKAPRVIDGGEHGVEWLTVRLGIVQRVVQPTAFFACDRRADDEVGNCREIT